MMSKTPYTGRQPVPWTREAWFAAEHDCDNGDRFMMLDDLLAKHPLIGKSRSEVEQLLGSMYSPDGGDASDGRYCLGPMSVYVPDYLWLVLWFDADDRVSWIETPEDLYQ